MKDAMDYTMEMMKKRPIKRRSAIAKPKKIAAVPLPHGGEGGEIGLTHSCPPFQHLLSERLASLGIMGAPRVPPLNPSETIVL